MVKSELQKKVNIYRKAQAKLREEVALNFPTGSIVRNVHYKGVVGRVSGPSLFHADGVEVDPWGNCDCMNLEVLDMPSIPAAQSVGNA